MRLSRNRLALCELLFLDSHQWLHSVACCADVSRFSSAFVLAPVIGEFSREPLKHAFFLHFFDTFPHLSKCERD